MPTVANPFRRSRRAPLARLRHKRKPPTAKERIMNEIERALEKATAFIRRHRGNSEGN